jgi:hypothetical protein
MLLKGPANSCDRLVRELVRRTRGLMFMSESDFPLHVVAWRRPAGLPSARRVATLAGETHPDLAQTMSVDAFFRAAATPQPWHDVEERATARRYASIVHFLKVHLHDLRVFRYGRLTIHAYVVGTTKAGDWIGLTTIQIET